MSQSLKPPNLRCIKYKWVFKIEHDRMYHTRLVACGYSQIPGIDYSKNNSPVMNHVTFCVLLLIMIHFGLLAKANIETAFLQGELEEEVYVEYLLSMKGIGKGECIILDKCIYGLVQATRQYNKKAVEILKKVGFTGGNAHPCLYYMQLHTQMTM